MRAFKLSWLGSLGLAVASLSHCLAPTEIVVWLSTDVGCPDVGVQGYAIVVGDPATIETQSPTTVTNGCSSDGGLGSIVVVPSGSDQARVGIRVVLGVDTTPDKCDLDSGYTGCIVARRELPYSPHEPLTLPIELLQICKNVGCAADTTCVAGTCVDASTPCTGGSCDLPDAGGTTIDGGDAGPCSMVSEAVNGTAVPSAARPRVAKTPTGWIVAFSTATDIRIVPITAGGVANVAQTVIIPTSGGGTNYLGPVASDGTTYALSYAGSTGFVLEIVGASGTVLSQAPISGASVPIEGMYYQSSPGFYFTAAADPGLGQIDLFEATQSDGGAFEQDKLASPGALSTGEDVGLTSPKYLLTATSGTTTCLLQTCVWTTSYACYLTTGFLAPANCTDAKATGNFNTIFYAYESNQSLAAFFVGAPASPYSVATLDGAGAYKPLTLGSTPFRLFWQQAGVLESAVISPTKQNPPDVHITLTNALPYTYMAFDVVADDPVVSPSWAAAYYSNGAVTFTHQCQ